MSTCLTRSTALRPIRLTAALTTLLAVTALSACGSNSTESSGSPEGDSATGSSSVAMSDAWVKAVGDDEEMTAAFGVLTNDGDDDVTLESATTPVAGMVELHEVVMKDGSMVMQPKEGGIPVPAGGEATLEPGGDHIMLMELTGPIEPGDMVELELKLSDGSTIAVDATAKEFSGADEDYEGDHSMGEG